MSVRLQFCERDVNISGYIQNDANLDDNGLRFVGLITDNYLYRSTLVTHDDDDNDDNDNDVLPLLPLAESC